MCMADFSLLKFSSLTLTPWIISHYSLPSCLFLAGFSFFWLLKIFLSPKLDFFPRHFPGSGESCPRLESSAFNSKNIHLCLHARLSPGTVPTLGTAQNTWYPIPHPSKLSTFKTKFITFPNIYVLPNIWCLVENPVLFIQLWTPGT